MSVVRLLKVLIILTRYQILRIVELGILMVIGGVLKMRSMSLIVPLIRYIKIMSGNMDTEKMKSEIMEYCDGGI